MFYLLTQPGVVMVAESQAPAYLYKVISRQAWEESKAQNQLILSPMDKDFIHLAKEDQVEYVVNKFWAGKDYLVLKLDTKKLVGKLVYESNPGGSTKYYHLYDGCIALDAVVEVKSVI